MEEASLRRILTVLRVRWKLVGLLALPVLLISWIYAATLPPSFTSTIVVSFAPETGIETGTAFAQSLAPYELTAISHRTLEKAEQDAGLRSGELHDGASAELPTNGLELSIEVTTASAETSVAAARSIVGSIRTAAADDPRVLVWNVSELPASHDGTPQRRMIVIAAGLIVAAIPGSFIALWREGANPRAWVPDDVRSLGVPVLQRIPRSEASRRRRTKSSASARPPALQLWWPLVWELDRGETTGDTPNELVVASSQRGKADAAAVADDLQRIAESATKEGGGSITVRPAVWDALRGSPGSLRAVPEIICLLVVHAGTPQEQLKTIAERIRGQGGRILGCVFVSR
ncbi:Wzz/FepE/Etk N-terminal domain-containing protein [Brevibacterium casei]|uniref:Wzz/FepE/Etk N-terminal domain-containing protein n=1 Tax=Brevibacterium casei TaxID=33889 RepID=UPI00191A89F9|nr:Wzz/FepE/Etk N-terminal domain-containing protein [Brevibacterium casei]QQT70247.1 hypothetical protein I6I57_04925 [Brevibacterium casei]